MTRIVGISPGNIAALGYEVITVKVAFVSVAITISLGSLNTFAWVAPHVGCQIWMSIHHTLIENSHDDRRIACAGLPCLKCIHVTSCLSTHVIIVEVLKAIVALAQVTVVPLAGKAWVVWLALGCCCAGSLLLKCLIAEIDALAVCIVSTLDATVGLNL